MFKEGTNNISLKSTNIGDIKKLYKIVSKNADGEIKTYFKTDEVATRELVNGPRRGTSYMPKQKKRNIIG